MSGLYILAYVFVSSLLFGIAYSLISIIISFIKNVISHNEHKSLHLHHEH